MPAQLKPGLVRPRLAVAGRRRIRLRQWQAGRPHHLLREQVEGHSCRPVAHRDEVCSVPKCRQSGVNPISTAQIEIDANDPFRTSLCNSCTLIYRGFSA